MSLGNGAPHLDGNSFHVMQAERRPIAIRTDDLPMSGTARLSRLCAGTREWCVRPAGTLGGVLWSSLRTLSDEASSRRT
jgi:hypothetical protein